MQCITEVEFSCFILFAGTSCGTINCVTDDLKRHDSHFTSQWYRGDCVTVTSDRSCYVWTWMQYDVWYIIFSKSQWTCFKQYYSLSSLIHCMNISHICSLTFLWVACVFQGTFWINVIIHNYLWITVMAFCSIVIMLADYKVECDYMDRTNPYGKIISTSHNLVWLAYHANRAFARWSQELGAKKQLFACLDYMLSARISI